MHRNDVVNLLQIAAAYDSRRIDELMVQAWGDAANRQHWTFETASDAIKQYYSRETDWIKPGNVTAEIRAMAPGREEYFSLPESSGDVASDESRGVFMSMIRGVLASKRVGFGSAVDDVIR